MTIDVQTYDRSDHGEARQDEGGWVKRFIGAATVVLTVFAGLAAAAVPAVTAGPTGTAAAATASRTTPGLTTEIGGNYNQGTCDIYQGLIAKSGVQWVRTFVNIPRNFLAFDSSNALVGVQQSNLTQLSDAVGGQGENLAISTATKLQQVKNTGRRGTPVKTVLSLKLDMKYLNVGVPTTPTDFGYWLGAITQFLSTLPDPNTQNPSVAALGASVDVLVVGNEPMYEVPEDQALAYGTFLGQMVDAIADLRSTYGWSFKIFTGALDKPGQNQANPILQQVLAVTNTNANVDGLDLHLHEDDLGDLSVDLGFIRTPRTANGAGVTKPLSVTEFSLVGLWDEHEDDLLSANRKWSARYRYPSDWTMNDWLNSLVSRASSGTPATSNEFGSYFLTQKWYPKGWFYRFISEFSRNGVVLATYGLSAPPGVPGLGDACGSSASPSVLPIVHSNAAPTAQAQANPMLFVIDFLYNGALLGLARDNFYERNPLVAADFEAILAKRGTSPRIGASEAPAAVEPGMSTTEESATTTTTKAPSTTTTARPLTTTTTSAVTTPTSLPSTATTSTTVATSTTTSAGSTSTTAG